MSRRAVFFAPTLVVAACTAWFGCKRSDMSEPSGSPIAPTVQDLEHAHRTPDPNSAGHQGAQAVVVDAGGITVLCTANPKGDGNHMCLIRLADDGRVTWQRHYSQGAGSIGRGLTELPGGGFVIAGETQPSAVEFQGSILHTDADGNVVAHASFGLPGVTGFNAIALLGDGSLLAGGGSAWKGWLLHATGALGPVSETPIGDVDDVLGVAAIADGGFAIAAQREKSTLGFGLTRIAAFARDGHLRWQAELPTTGRGEPAALTSFPDGSLVAVGHRVATDHDKAQIWVVRMTTSGAVAWERLLGPPDEERRGRAIVALADGGVAVAGEALRDNRRGLRVARLAADGEVAWEHAYGGDKYDVATGLAATADGGLVLVGATMSKGPGKTNIWVLRLDREGRVLWDRVFGTAAER